MLRRLGHIREWYDREILPGSDWRSEISSQLDSAHIVLLLVSPDFVASDYCFEVEMRQALKRHAQGKARVLPIIVRPVDYRGAPFDGLQALPKEAKPVTLWSNADEAWHDVAVGIRTVCDQVLAGAAAGVGREVAVALPAANSFQFLSPNDIRDTVLAAVSLKPADRVIRELLIFETMQQHTWLVFTARDVICVLDDAETRRTGDEVQWVLARSELHPIKATRSTRTSGLLEIGPPPRWLYSSHLFPTPEALERTLKQILS